MSKRTASASNGGQASSGFPVFTGLDYAKFFAAGALCCTVTHGMTTPIDVVKTRSQIDDVFKGKGMLTVGRSIVAKEGTKGLLTGFGPTAVGYLLQGGGKFAGYEYMKSALARRAGSYENAVAQRQFIYLFGAAAAETAADVLLTPCEAVRIRLVSDPSYAKGMPSGFMRMLGEGGVRQLYAGFIPIVAKQVPYALGQFVVNEQMHEVAKKQLGAEAIANYGPLGNTALTLGCGIVAGVAAAVLSHPADTLLSRINKGQGGKGSATSKLIRLAKEAGPVGIWSGLGPRIVMTAFLVSGQFGLFGVFKSAFGAPPGIEIHRED